MYVTPCTCKVCGLPFLFSFSYFKGGYVGVIISVVVYISFPWVYANITSIATHVTSNPHLQSTPKHTLENVSFSHFATCTVTHSDHQTACGLPAHGEQWRGECAAHASTYSQNISSSITSTLLDIYHTNNSPQLIHLKGPLHNQTHC